MTKIVKKRFTNVKIKQQRGIKIPLIYFTTTPIYYGLADTYYLVFDNEGFPF